MADLIRVLANRKHRSNKAHYWQVTDNTYKLEVNGPPGGDYTSTRTTRTHAQTQTDKLKTLLPSDPLLRGRGNEESVPKIAINDTIYLFFKLQSAFC